MDFNEFCLFGDLPLHHCQSETKSPILQPAGSYGEAGPLKGSCSSQSNLLQG